jgi:hypothetical protein
MCSFKYSDAMNMNRAICETTTGVNRNKVHQRSSNEVSLERAGQRRRLRQFVRGRRAGATSSRNSKAPQARTPCPLPGRSDPEPIPLHDPRHFPSAPRAASDTAARGTDGRRARLLRRRLFSDKQRPRIDDNVAREGPGTIRHCPTGKHQIQPSTELTGGAIDGVSHF